MQVFNLNSPLGPRVRTRFKSRKIKTGTETEKEAEEGEEEEMAQDDIGKMVREVTCMSPMVHGVPICVCKSGIDFC